MTVSGLNLPREPWPITHLANSHGLNHPSAIQVPLPTSWCLLQVSWTSKSEEM
jgi:hypothetical protein